MLSENTKTLKKLEHIAESRDMSVLELRLTYFKSIFEKDMISQEDHDLVEGFLRARETGRVLDEAIAQEITVLKN